MVVTSRCARAVSRVVVVALLAATASCTLSSTSTGAKTGLDAQAVARVRRMGVQVVVKNPFSVLVARNEGDNVGFLALAPAGLAGALIGAAIEHGARVAADAHAATALRPRLGDLDCETYLRANLVRALQASHRFDDVAVLGGTEQPGDVDAILRLEVQNWGVRAGARAEAGTPARVGMEARVTLTPPSAASVMMWERNDYFSGGAVHPLDDFEVGTLLRTDVEATLGGYADRIALEVRLAG